MLSNWRSRKSTYRGSRHPDAGHNAASFARCSLPPSTSCRSSELNICLRGRTARLLHYPASQLHREWTRNHRNLTNFSGLSMRAAGAKQLHRHRYAFMPVVWPKRASHGGNTRRNFKKTALLPSRMPRLSHVDGCYLNSSAN
jgi:hypothetical protein